ncbi:Heterokaryon incompatibility protein (HET) domain containing protein [Rhypophila sp. PSN 637]
MATPEGSSIGPVVDYQYEELKSPDEIRLLTVLPGEFDDDIILRITNERLLLPDPQPRLMSMTQLQETLPPGWEVDRTRDGRFIFLHIETSPTAPVLLGESWTHPDPGFDPSCYMSPVQHPEPAYEALSYTWGDFPGGANTGLKCVYIKCCSHISTTEAQSCTMNCLARLSVTSNLAAALRHLRSDNSRALPFWIDAISINQASIPERNTQVLRMTDVFRLARRVIVWLGPSSSDSCHALDTLSHLGKHFASTWRHMIVRSPDGSERPPWDHKTHLPYDNDTWAAVDQLVRRPWFSRVWVVQEVQLASEALVYCGKDTIPWDWLCQACIFIAHNYYQPLATPDLELVYGIGERACGIRSSRETACIATRRMCTNPRDLVYGMLGIYPGGLRARVVPDYSKEAWEVYRDLTLGHVEFVKRLEMLQLCRSSQNRRDQSGWPSWVPDFHSVEVDVDFVTFAAGYSRASFGMGLADSKTVNSGASSLLPVEGIQCTSVTRVRDLSPLVALGFSAIGEAFRDLGSDNDQCQGLYATGESLLDAYATTLGLGYFDERFPHHSLPSLQLWVERLSQLGLLGPRLPEVRDYDDALWLSFDTSGLAHIEKYPILFETAQGYYGFGPIETLPGDVIAVVLGCDAPMVLRPHRESSTYAVVGQAYCHGLHDATALLGPLPHPWHVQVFEDNTGNLAIYRFHNPETGELSDEDPRLDPLPAEWERITRGRTEDDPQSFQCFRNKSTGETIDYDPRLSPDALRARGVDIRTFCLA